MFPRMFCLPFSFAFLLLLLLPPLSFSSSPFLSFLLSFLPFTAYLISTFFVPDIVLHSLASILLKNIRPYLDTLQELAIFENTVGISKWKCVRLQATYGKSSPS